MDYPTLKELPPPPQDRTGWPWTEAPPLLPDIRSAHHGWPKVTIVTPSYNQGQFLEMTLRSVLLQGYPNLEFIVIDGGSNDDSVAIIRKYEPWLAYWVSEKDKGQTNAINKGFARATGLLYAYLNSDDYYEPGAIIACVKAFVTGQEWIVGQVRCWHADAGYLPFPVIPGKNIIRWFLCCPVAQAGSFWSARLHRQTGGFREDLNYILDYEFWLRLRFGLAIKPFWLHQAIAVYRLHPASKTMAQSTAFAAEIIQIRKHYRLYLNHGQRVWLRIARRRRKARELGALAVMLVKKKNRRAALKALLAAVRAFPLMAFDLVGVALAFKALTNKNSPKTIFPQLEKIDS